MLSFQHGAPRNRNRRRHQPPAYGTASEYKGDLSLALADLVHAREGLEDFAERSEAAHENALRALRDRSEADFREGRTVAWEDVKARNGL
jgi:hypothetical protein